MISRARAGPTIRGRVQDIPPSGEKPIEGYAARIFVPGPASAMSASNARLHAGARSPAVHGGDDRDGGLVQLTDEVVEETRDLEQVGATILGRGESVDVAARTEVRALADEQDGADLRACRPQSRDALLHSRGGQGGAVLGGRHGDPQDPVLHTHQRVKRAVAGRKGNLVLGHSRTISGRRIEQ